MEVPLYEVFHKGKVDLNSVKFETRSIVQIECSRQSFYYHNV